MTKRAASAGPRAVEKQSSLGSHRPEIQVRVAQATTPATYEAETIVVGIQPDIALAMVRLGTTLHPVRTALDLEEGLAHLDSSAPGDLPRRDTRR